MPRPRPRLLRPAPSRSARPASLDLRGAPQRRAGGRKVGRLEALERVAAPQHVEVVVLTHEPVASGREQRAVDTRHRAGQAVDRRLGELIGHPFRHAVEEQGKGEDAGRVVLLGPRAQGREALELPDRIERVARIAWRGSSPPSSAWITSNPMNRRRGSANLRPTLIARRRSRAFPSAGFQQSRRSASSSRSASAANSQRSRYTASFSCRRSSSESSSRSGSSSRYRGAA